MSLSIGLLGCGTVGKAVARRLLALRPDAGLSLQAICVRNVCPKRADELQFWEFTTDASRLVEDAGIHVIIECLGGLEPSRSLIRSALQNGKHVVSANKAVLATYGEELFEVADSCGRMLLFDAAVGGAVPVVALLRSHFRGEQLTEVSGVLNGTSNFVLSAMEAGRSFEDALGETQTLGYAEADPSADVEGIDAAQKLSLLMHLVFASWLPWERIPRTGIKDVTTADVLAAQAQGRSIRLVATARREGQAVFASVRPRLLPENDPLSHGKGTSNTICIVGENCGNIMLSGPGAGGAETASAVMGDLFAIADATRLPNPTSHGVGLRCLD